MGSRSRARARAQANGTADQPDQPGLPSRSPATVTGGAVVVAIESLIVLTAAVLAGIAAASGQSYQAASGIAITVIGLVTATGLGLVAAGLARVRRWSRTPALLTQLFCGIVGIYLVQGGRLWWGVPLLVLATAGFALLLAPPSFRALSGQDLD